MAEYQFELVFKLEKDEDSAHYLDLLFEAGCDDATPSIGAKGFIGLSFSRKSCDAVEALKSAMSNVKVAISHAQILRAEPWLMNMTELSEELGFTKQNIRKYLRGETSFGVPPSPVVTGKTSYWLIAEVATWLTEIGIIAIQKEKQELYQSIWGLNTAIEQLRNPNSNEFYGWLKTA